MQISGTYRLNAAPDLVRARLMDPTIVASWIARCDALALHGDDRSRARLTVALAAITGTYDGTVTVSDLVPGASYRLTAEGKGKPGFIKGDSLVSLIPDGPATIVYVSGTLHMGGTIARLGQRLIGSVSQMMMDRFFGCLQSRVDASV